ncbi:MAG TPA: SDR family NAD(P)-dependent oxidoreductase [Streptosporangiaceae bacterium]|nr:SDR family NAD(P)-dependent oxidoreductase [Streptosporangiaceae bacterium]
MDFDGKVVFVTGGGSGIGAACVRRFADHGARVVAADINGDNVAKVAADIGDDVRAVTLDVTDPDAVADAVAGVTATEGALHVAVNNAGITGALAPTHTLSLEDFRRAIDINLAGVFHGMRAEIPAMLESGGGVIVNTASVAAASGYPYAAAYCASKHGVLGLTRAAGVEYAQAGIRVVAVGPGAIDTPMTRAAPPEVAQAAIEMAPAKRPGTADEVAAAICFLASPDASFITGSYHAVDGGYLAQ